MPIGLDQFCAVKYAKDQVFVIGGFNLHYSGKRVFIFNPMNGFTHIEGPSLKTSRYSHACGLMSNGQQTKIVVAGGLNNPNGVLNSVEIFDPSVNDWISGKK